MLAKFGEIVWSERLNPWRDGSLTELMDSLVKDGWWGEDQTPAIVCVTQIFPQSGDWTVKGKKCSFSDLLSAEMNLRERMRKLCEGDDATAVSALYGDCEPKYIALTAYRRASIYIDATIKRIQQGIPCQPMIPIAIVDYDPIRPEAFNWGR